MLDWIWGYVFTYYWLLLLYFYYFNGHFWWLVILATSLKCFVWWVKYFYTSPPPPHIVPEDYIRKCKGYFSLQLLPKIMYNFLLFFRLVIGASCILGSFLWICLFQFWLLFICFEFIGPDEPLNLIGSLWCKYLLMHRWWFLLKITFYSQPRRMDQ